MAMILSAILFVVFVTNVALGALAGAPFLGDVQEMILLFAASVAFVVAIIKREATAKTNNIKDAH